MVFAFWVLKHNQVSDNKTTARWQDKDESTKIFCLGGL
jgi:hypothetical protein